MSNVSNNPAFSVPLPAAVVQKGGMSPVPAATYLCRFTSAKEHVKEAEAGKPPKLSIHVTGEIVSPDLVTDPETNQQYNVAQRKFDMYLTVDPSSAGYAGTYQLMQRLSLLQEDGSFLPAAAMAALSAGDVFAPVNLYSSPEYVRRSPKPGQRIGDVVLFNGQPQIRGHRIDLVSPEFVQSRVAPPDGFVAPRF